MNNIEDLLNELKNKIQELQTENNLYKEKELLEKSRKKQYYEKNFDAIKKRKAQYQKENPEKKKLYQKRWREKQKLKIN